MARALFDSSEDTNAFVKTGRYLKALVKTGVVSRAVGAKPIWAQLKITERCNLNCSYCTEHKNNGQHVPLETVRSWLAHCSELGVKHVEFIGGEPLIHPDLLEMVDIARQLRMQTGFTTNGFLLKEELARKLVEKGVMRWQLSIDCIEPNSVTRKAINLLKPQLKYLRDAKIWTHVNSVIIPETISQAYDLAKCLFEMKIPVAFSPVHDCGKLRLTSANDRVIEFLDWLSIERREGAPVNMPQFLINYYRDKLSGKDVPWICEGGCKAFYVDTKGNFRTCSHSPSCLKFEEVESKTLRLNHRRGKGCEGECGVSCMIINSFMFNRLDYVLKAELAPSSWLATLCVR